MQGQHILVVPSDKLKSTPLELLESIAFAKNPADVNIAAGRSDLKAAAPA